MHTVFDLADWFLGKAQMTHKKLQKLCYYAQAWSYAIQPEPISNAVFEAWVHGPVCRELYNRYHTYGFGYIPQGSGTQVFTDDENDFLEDVWTTYEDLSPNAIEALTHSELPWQKARVGLDSGEPSDRAIDPNDMRDFYRSIYTRGGA